MRFPANFGRVVIELFGKVRRSLYVQLDGSHVRADDCTCESAGPSLLCPVDAHSIAARRKELEHPCCDSTLRRSA